MTYLGFPPGRKVCFKEGDRVFAVNGAVGLSDAGKRTVFTGQTNGVVVEVDENRTAPVLYRDCIEGDYWVRQQDLLRWFPPNTGRLKKAG